MRGTQNWELKRDDIIGGWRKLLNEEIHSLYPSPRIIRTNKPSRMKLAGHIARIGEKRNAYMILMGYLDGNRPLGRERHRWVDNIKMGLRDMVRGGMD
jgi:hypothetical protein